MIEIIGDIAVTAVMAVWLLGSGFMAHALTNGDVKHCNRLHALFLLAWAIVASQLYVF